MDVLLLSTILSLAAATILGTFALRLHQEQQRRSAARIAALAASVDAADDDRIRSSAAVPVSSLFETAPGRSVQGRPLIKIGVGLMMALLLIVITAMSGSGTDTSPSPSVQATAAAGKAPLELVSMRQSREGGTLKVAGLLRNPRAGAPVSGLTAVVFAFDRSGNFLTSGRAPLDFLTLEPGDESPFVVNVAEAATAARYRVSFRTDAGVVRHVDRRQAGTFAAR